MKIPTATLHEKSRLMVAKNLQLLQLMHDKFLRERQTASQVCILPDPDIVAVHSTAAEAAGARSGTGQQNAGYRHGERRTQRNF